jgi:hypothetical protein
MKSRELISKIMHCKSWKKSAADKLQLYLLQVYLQMQHQQGWVIIRGFQWRLKPLPGSKKQGSEQSNYFKEAGIIT